MGSIDFLSLCPLYSTQQHQLTLAPLKKSGEILLGMLGIEPWASGREAGMLPLCSPLNPLFFLSDRDAEGVRRRLGVGRHSPSGKAFQEEPRDKEMRSGHRGTVLCLSRLVGDWTLKAKVFLLKRNKTFVTTVLKLCEQASFFLLSFIRRIHPLKDL